MTTIRKQCIYFGLLLVLLLQLILTANGQSKPAQLQRIVFKDKELERNLNGFVNTTKVNAVLVVLERRDKAYLYKLAGIYSFDRIKKYPKVPWGQWHNRIIVFNSGPELKEVCTISDTTSFANLLNYVRPWFPNRDSSRVTNKNYKIDPSIPDEGLEWMFKVENGKEIWLWANNGYDSREVVEVPVSN